MDAYHSPPALGRPSEVVITTWGLQSIGVPLWTANFAASGSNIFPVANTALYVPFVLPETTTFTRFGWLNSTPVGGNLDVGIYDAAYNKVVSSGSTAQASANIIQAVDITDTTVPRGLYYMALASDTANAGTQKLFGAVPAAGIVQSFGVLQQAVYPLPSPAVPIACATAFVPLIIALTYRAVGIP